MARVRSSCQGQGLGCASGMKHACCTPMRVNGSGEVFPGARARLALGVAELAEVVDAVEHRALERDGRVQVVLPAGLVHADACARRSATRDLRAISVERMLCCCISATTWPLSQCHP